ncbi:MAG: IS630 family transposase [Oligoflexia bacterium]|nr:IS630 family transposase [Oligoflexia bacterium]
MSISSLRRALKRLGFCWKRVRKSLRSKRNQEEFERVKAEIEELVEKHKRGELELYFFDQSGFSLQSSVPYAYQEKGFNIEIPSTKSKRLNVLGMISPTLDFKSMLYEGNINSEIVMDTIDDFIKYKRAKTRMIIVLDNSSLHHSDDFEEKRFEWELRGVELKFLPSYSPELNKIEILWRFIKYQWLPFSAYGNIKQLSDELCEVLRGIGNKYQITFG